MNTSSLRAFGRQTVIPALGIIVMVLSLIDTGYQSSVRGLDLSWHAMLGYAHAHNLQHGRDLLFNYGPLSFMESAIYFEKNHADVLLLRGLYALTLGLCFFCVLRIRRVIDLLLFCALALFLVLLHDVYLLLPALLLAHNEVQRGPKDRARLAVSIVLAFDMALACQVQSGAVFLSVPVLLLVTAYRIRLRDYVPVVPVCFVFFSLLVFAWAGQDLVNFPAFVAGYFDVSQAYNADMGLHAPWGYQLAFALGALVVGSTFGLRGMQQLLVSALSILSLMVAYKMGFIRHGEHPFASFLALAFLGAVQLWSPASHFRNRGHPPDRAIAAAGRRVQDLSLVDQIPRRVPAEHSVQTDAGCRLSAPKSEGPGRAPRRHSVQGHSGAI
ncbi:MAG: hypothetical protein IPQ22_15435 [Rhodoferax sp.]|nr:hypothetical protein [Rhodoferax sp.]